MPAYVDVELGLLTTLVFEEVNCFDYILIEMSLVTLGVEALNFVFALFYIILVHL